MMSKNILAALIIVVIMISLVGTYVILNSITEEGQKTVAATAKVNVIGPPKPPSSSGYIAVNVIETTKFHSSEVVD